MTDEVAALVLRDNYDQTEALATARAQAAPMVDVHARYLRWLEAEAGLDRALEFLPSDEELAQRRPAAAGLTSPEFAVLLAYTKIDLSSRLLASDACRGPVVRPGAGRLLPDAAARRAVRRGHGPPPAAPRDHRHPGHQPHRRPGRHQLHLPPHRGDRRPRAPDLARAHVAAWEIFGLEELWSAVEALDNVVPAATQIEMMLPDPPPGRTGHPLAACATARSPSTWPRAMAANASGAARLARLLPSLLSATDRTAAETLTSAWVEAGAGKDLAARVAALDGLAPALDVLHVAGGTPSRTRRGSTRASALSSPGSGEPGSRDVLDDVAAVYFAIGEALELD